MAKEFTDLNCYNYDDYHKLIEKHINLLNVDEYNLPEIRKKVEENEKREKFLQKKRKQESDKIKKENEEKEKEEKEEEESSLNDFDSEEKSTEENTKELEKLENENEEETESIPPVFDLTKAKEYRNNLRINSDDELSESFSQIEKNY